MNTVKMLRSARNAFALASAMFVAAAGGTIWTAHEMGDGGMLNLHGHQLMTLEKEDRATIAENGILGLFAFITVLMAGNWYYYQRKYAAAQGQPDTPHIS